MNEEPKPLLTRRLGQWLTGPSWPAWGVRLLLALTAGALAGAATFQLLLYVGVVLVVHFSGVQNKPSNLFDMFLALGAFVLFGAAALQVAIIGCAIAGLGVAVLVWRWLSRRSRAKAATDGVPT